MKVGIIGAMDNEVKALIGALENDFVTERCHLAFHEGFIDGVPVVVVKSGVGKVSMASCAQQLCDLFNVDMLVNTGVAGAVDDTLDIGDVVVSTDLVHHDMDVTVLGYAPGQIPGYPQSFPADKRLAEKVVAAAAAVEPDVTVRAGRIATGDRFVSSVEDRAAVRETFGALCAEMEGAAIAQVGWLNDVPFVVLRAISDHADGTGAESYQAFEDLAADRMARLLIATLSKLAR